MLYYYYIIIIFKFKYESWYILSPNYPPLKNLWILSKRNCASLLYSIYLPVHGTGWWAMQRRDSSFSVQEYEKTALIRVIECEEPSHNLKQALDIHYEVPLSNWSHKLYHHWLALQRKFWILEFRLLSGLLVTPFSKRNGSIFVGQQYEVLLICTFLYFLWAFTCYTYLVRVTCE